MQQQGTWLYIVYCISLKTDVYETDSLLICCVGTCIIIMSPVLCNFLTSNMHNYCILWNYIAHKFVNHGNEIIFCLYLSTILGLFKNQILVISLTGGHLECHLEYRKYAKFTKVANTWFDNCRLTKTKISLCQTKQSAQHLHCMLYINR